MFLKKRNKETTQSYNKTIYFEEIKRQSDFITSQYTWEEKRRDNLAL